ncbi:hypothetical protein LBMAG18_11720 [Alphaproteobacteria bacterium]|nr:hypothetical protein LBMAG18_11720 [Alphaproteobacteria bacterium]
MIDFFLNIIVVGVFLLYLGCAISFLKAKDIYTMTQITFLTHCFVTPLVLLAIELQKFSWLTFAKITLIIFLNLIIASLICHIICRRAIINRIIPDADE